MKNKIPEYERTIRLGIPSASIMICEEAPAESAVLQGEYRNGVCAGDDGEPSWDYFYYSGERLHMREALAKKSNIARGLRSDLLLRLHMSPGSYEDRRDPTKILSLLRELSAKRSCAKQENGSLMIDRAISTMLSQPRRRCCRLLSLSRHVFVRRRRDQDLSILARHQNNRR